MASFDHEKTKKEAVRRFELHASGKEALPADLRSAVYKAAISFGGEEVFETMMKVRVRLLL
jgi:puromycin-sensitive aminopeptidase